MLVFLHVCWSVLWFSGWSNLKEFSYTSKAGLVGMLKIGAVLFTHMLVSCLVNKPSFQQ